MIKKKAETESEKLVRIQRNLQIALLERTPHIFRVYHHFANNAITVWHLRFPDTPGSCLLGDLVVEGLFRRITLFEASTSIVFKAVFEHSVSFPENFGIPQGNDIDENSSPHNCYCSLSRRI